VRRERSSGLPGGRGCWSARGSCAGVRAGVRRTCTCAPEAAAVAASSSSGSDDRAVRQLRHPAASSTIQISIYGSQSLLSLEGSIKG